MSKCFTFEVNEETTIEEAIEEVQREYPLLPIKNIVDKAFEKTANKYNYLWKISFAEGIYEEIERNKYGK